MQHSKISRIWMKEKDSRDNMSKNFHSHANKTETELVDE